jgi:hypothetical protein
VSIIEEKYMKAFITLAVASLVSASAMAQIKVDTGGTSVVIGAGGGVDVRTKDSGSVSTKGSSTTAIATEGNTARNTVGGIGSNVDIQGVAVINGRVYIDNKEIPADVTRYKSPRTGEVYIIKRKGTSVEVVSEPGAKK